MKIKVYTVELDLTPRQKAVVRGGVVAGAVIAALGIGLAIASPHQWATNDALKATDLNSLNVVTLTTDAGTAQYSVGATKYCGVTSGNYDGAQVGGYRGGKGVCQATCSSATAHMCTNDELIRTKALGGTVSTFSTPYAWYSSGVWVQYGTDQQFDCSSWTSNSSTFLASAWRSTDDTPNNVQCNNQFPILCCD